MMCAEAVPWRCHRQLIADTLVTRGVTVHHILGPGQERAHELNPSARPGSDGVLDLSGGRADASHLTALSARSQALS